MPFDHRLALRRARRTGVLICLVTLGLAALFVVGLAQRSYWALAVPVAIGVLSVLWLTFWIGYTINTVRGIPAEADHYEGRGTRIIALGICVVSVLVALVFLGGVARQSYWALAIPVSAGVLSLAGMVFWIGWAIVTQRSTLPEPAAEPPAARPAEPAEPPVDAGP
ncbi:MAG TPA: hypothetical protein VKB51_07430 [bacterium]|nr:hypothetical protein [bacterium]